MFVPFTASSFPRKNHNKSTLYYILCTVELGLWAEELKLGGCNRSLIQVVGTIC